MITIVTLDLEQSGAWHGDDDQRADDLERGLRRAADDRQNETHVYDIDGIMLRAWAPAHQRRAGQ